MKRVLVCAAAAAVWTVSLSEPAQAAQAGQPCISEMPEAYPWPPSLTEPTDSELANLAVVGDFNEDLAGDVIWVQEGTAVISIKPALYKNVTLPVHVNEVQLEGVTGLALSSGEGIDYVEAFYAATSAGLTLCSQTSASGDPGAFTGQAVVGSAWNDATHLHTADLDGGQGRYDVFGINAAQDKVLVALHDGQGHGPTMQLSCPLGSILDVTSVDWFHDGVRHLAVLGQDGLGIFRLAPPALVQVYLMPQPEGAITTVKLPSGFEAVAWARPETPSSAVLMLKGSGGVSAGPIVLDLQDCQQPSGPTNVLPFAMEACDYDLQPGEDLVLALPDERVAILKNQGAPAFFSTSSNTHYDIGIVGDLYGLPGVGQLDDGPDDIALPGTDGELYIFTKLPYAYAIENGPPTSADILHEQSEWGLPVGALGEDDRQLNMAFTVPTEYSFASHIEVILWYLDPFVSGNVSAAVHRKVYPLVTGTNQWIPLIDMEDETCWPGPHQYHYFTEYRFVVWNGTAITQASRAFSAGFTLRMNCDTEAGFDEGTDDAFLAGLIAAQTGGYQYLDGIQIESSSELSLGTGNDGYVHGLFHPSARPPLDPGNLPAPVPITVGTSALGFN